MPVADAGVFESGIYRLRTSFSSDKDRLLGRITDINNQLHQFLDRETKVSRPPPCKPRLPLGRLQTDANAFYKRLTECWHCSCSIPHKVGIALCPVPSSLPRTIGIKKLQALLGDDCGGTLLSIHSDLDMTANYCLPDLNLDLTRASKIGGQLREKKQRDEAAKALADNNVAALAISSLTISSPKPNREPKVSSFKSILKRTTSKIHKSVTGHGKNADNAAMRFQISAHKSSPAAENLGITIPQRNGFGDRNPDDKLRLG